MENENESSEKDKAEDKSEGRKPSSKPKPPRFRELKDEMVLGAIERQMCDQNLGDDGKG